MKVIFGRSLPPDPPPTDVPPLSRIKTWLTATFNQIRVLFTTIQPLRALQGWAEGAWSTRVTFVAKVKSPGQPRSTRDNNVKMTTSKSRGREVDPWNSPGARIAWYERRWDIEGRGRDGRIITLRLGTKYSEKMEEMSVKEKETDKRNINRWR